MRLAFCVGIRIRWDFLCRDLHFLSIDDFSLYCLIVPTFMTRGPIITASMTYVFLVFSIIRVTVSWLRSIFYFIGIWLRFVALMTGWPIIFTISTLCLLFLPIIVIASCFYSFQFVFCCFCFMSFHFYVWYVMHL